MMIRFKTILFLFVICQASSAQENNCQDKETNVYWDGLAIYYTVHIDATNSVKLRKQLCRQIYTGDISVEDATKIIERKYARVVYGLAHGRL